MLDVIVYEDDEVSIKENRKIVSLGLGDISYKFKPFDKWNEQLTGLINTNYRKVYIINLDTENNNGLKLAKEIRKKHLNDIIILTAKCTKYYDIVFDNRLLVFDYICKNNHYGDRLLKAISDASKLLLNEDIFTFKYNHMIYRIPYGDINYIEKEINIKRCIIHTNNNKYYIVSSIDKLLDNLNANFVKTHQSCIVNIDNIRLLDCINNHICFDNKEYTALLTEKAKKEIKKIMLGN